MLAVVVASLPLLLHLAPDLAALRVGPFPVAWLLLGAIAMRGAGCVYNDMVDKDLDAKVARTAARPLASGAVSVRAAWLWLLALCLVHNIEISSK